MKKLLSVFMLFGLIVSCNNEEIINDNEIVSPTEVKVVNTLQGPTCINVPNGVTQVKLVNWADKTDLGTYQVVNGHVWVGSDEWTTVEIYDASPKQNAKGVKKANGELTYLGDTIVKKINNDLITLYPANKVNSGYNSEDFLKMFPPGRPSKGQSILYVSNGLPFSIYPIYTQGWYDLTLGLFYYDLDNNKHEIDIWDTQDCNWKPTFEYLFANEVKDVSLYTIAKTENAEGFSIVLPDEYVFGFYVKSRGDGKAGTFYSYRNENACNENHSVNFVDANGINYLSFEDQDRGDNDMNDLICYLTPTQKSIDEPTPEKIDSIINERKDTIKIIDDEIDKIVHWTTDSFDIEARYSDWHKYLRINIPLKNNKIVKVNLKKFQDFCEMDDTRIVTNNDSTILYKEIETSETIVNNTSAITLINNNKLNEYGTVIAEIVPTEGEEPNGTYQLKIELYPKGEDAYDKIMKMIINNTIADGLFE